MQETTEKKVMFPIITIKTTSVKDIKDLFVFFLTKQNMA